MIAEIDNFKMNLLIMLQVSQIENDRLTMESARAYNAKGMALLQNLVESRNGNKDR